MSSCAVLDCPCNSEDVNREAALRERDEARADVRRLQTMLDVSVEAVGELHADVRRLLAMLDRLHAAVGKSPPDIEQMTLVWPAWTDARALLADLTSKYGEARDDA